MSTFPKVDITNKNLSNIHNINNQLENDIYCPYTEKYGTCQTNDNKKDGEDNKKSNNNKAKIIDPKINQIKYTGYEEEDSETEDE